MNYTQTYKKMIIEAEETFAKYIPDSEEILKSIKIVVCSSDSVEKEVMKFCKKFNAQYRDFDLTDQIILGKTVNGEGEYGIVLNEEADDADDSMFMTMWHEMAHCYAREYDGIACHMLDMPSFNEDFGELLRKRFNLNKGYDFWKEFIAESIAYYLMQKTDKYQYYVETIPNLDQMLENCLDCIDPSYGGDSDQDEYLYKYFALLFAERRQKMITEHIDTTVNDPEVEYQLKGDTIMASGFAWIDENLKDALGGIFEALYEQMNNEQFWITDENFVMNLGIERDKFIKALSEYNDEA